MENSTQLLESSGETTLQENYTSEKNTHSSYFSTILSVSNSIKDHAFMVVLPIGIALNFLTILSFLKIKIHKTSTGLYMVCLAASEFLLLIGLAIYVPWPYWITKRTTTSCIL